MRYNVGTDYQSYAELSEGFALGDAECISRFEKEPLFILFSKTAYLVGQSRYFFFLADAVVMNTILFLAFDYYRKEVSLPLLYLLYYSWCFGYFLNIERQGLAVIILWFSIRYVKERKPIRFLLCICLAFLFHNTSVVGLILYPAYWFLSKKDTRVMKFLLITISFFVPALFGVSIAFLQNYVPIFSKYVSYLTQVLQIKIEANWVLNWTYMVCVSIVLVPFLRMLRQSEVGMEWLLFLCFWQLSSYLLSAYISSGYRMAFYFEIGIMLCYAYIVPRLKSRFNRVALNSFILGACLFHFTYKFYIRGKAEIFPYQTVLSVIRNVQKYFAV